MLGKVFKHEMKSTSRLFLPLMIGFIAITLLCKFTFETSYSAILGNNRLMETITVIFFVRNSSWNVFRSSSSVTEMVLINSDPSVRMVADWMVISDASLKVIFIIYISSAFCGFVLFIFNNILFFVVYECIIYCFLLFVNNLFKKSLTKPHINSEISLSILSCYSSCSEDFYRYFC